MLLILLANFFKLYHNTTQSIKRDEIVKQNHKTQNKVIIIKPKSRYMQQKKVKCSKTEQKMKNRKINDKEKINSQNNSSYVKLYVT